MPTHSSTAVTSGVAEMSEDMKVSSNVSPILEVWGFCDGQKCIINMGGELIRNKLANS